MTISREDVIEAMAKALHIFDRHCYDDDFEGCDAIGCYRQAASNALSAIEALGVRLVPVEAPISMIGSVMAEAGVWGDILKASPLKPGEE